MDLRPGQLDVFAAEVLNITSLSRHLEKAIAVPVDREGRSVKDLYAIAAKSIPKCKVDPGRGGLAEIQSEVNRCIKQWIDQLPDVINSQKDNLSCPKPVCSLFMGQNCCGLSFQHGYDKHGCLLYPCGRCDKCSSPANHTVSVRDERNPVFPAQLQRQTWWAPACARENMTTLEPIGPGVNGSCLSITSISVPHAFGSSSFCCCLFVFSHCHFYSTPRPYP